MPSDRDASIHDFLPLRPVIFSILLVLHRAPLHGYAVMKRVNARLGKPALVGPGTLYRTLKELRDAGWIEHAAAPASSASTDGRRQYYRLTARGNEVMAAEARRIAGLMRDAELDGLLGEEPS